MSATPCDALVPALPHPSQHLPSLAPNSSSSQRPSPASSTGWLPRLEALPRPSGWILFLTALRSLDSFSHRFIRLPKCQGWLAYVRALQGWLPSLQLLGDFCGRWSRVPRLLAAQMSPNPVPPEEQLRMSTIYSSCSLVLPGLIRLPRGFLR